MKKWKGWILGNVVGKLVGASDLFLKREKQKANNLSAK